MVFGPIRVNQGNYGTGVGNLPTLKDVLDIIPRGKILQSELKAYSKEMLDAHVKLIIDAHTIEASQIKFISFSAGSSTYGLQYAKSIMPNTSTFLLKDFGTNTSTSVIDAFLTTVKDIKADGVIVNKSLFLTHNNMNYINKIKDTGLVFGAYTSNVYYEYIILQDRGVDMITTDTPNLHHDFRIKKGKTYDVNKLNNYHIDGEITTVKGLGSQFATMAYFYNNAWLSSFDGSIIQSWINNSVKLIFNTGQANNEDIPSTYGSSVTSTNSAHIVTGSGCPNINLSWLLADGASSADVWEVHSSGTFNMAFGVDNKPVAQMDTDGLPKGSTNYPANPCILFSTTNSTAQIKIVGFRIGNATDMTTNAAPWIIKIFENNTSGTQVYSQTTNALGPGNFQEIIINYMGLPGVNYMMEFEDGNVNGGTTGMNNLIFEQHTNQTPSGNMIP